VLPPLTPEDLSRFRWVDHVRLSPRGDRLAYQEAWADVDSRHNMGRVVVCGLEPGAEARELPAMGRRDHSPEWSPDGSRLAFLSRQGPRDQLFVISLESWEPARLTDVPDGVLDARWSPDGRWLAFRALVLADPEAVLDDPRPAGPAGEDERVRRPPIARVARRLDYKRDGRGYRDGRHAHLFVVPADGGEAQQLTTGAWSPSGELVAFVAPLVHDGGRHERVWVVRAGGGDERCLTAGLDRAVGGSVFTDMRSGREPRLCWSGTGDRVYFQASGPGIAELCSVDLSGFVRVELACRERALYDFDVGDGVGVACISDAFSPGDVFVADAGGERRLTDSNPWLRDRYVAVPRRHEFTAADGWRLEGWLLEPPGFDPGRRHPLVMEIHGGPHGQFGWAFFHEFQVLAGMGFCVLYVNPRGSDGYGEEFKRAVVRDWGGKDYEDLMTALDQLIERSGFVDESRLGVGGGSYGGYLTNWIIGHTDRFAAAVAMRSLSNLVSEYAQHDIVLWGQLELGPPPWSSPDELWRRSPIRYVDRIRTPLLLTHGEMDRRRSCSAPCACWAGRWSSSASRASRTSCPGAAGPTGGWSG
jgi:dipeptidyl aminopeptidase/acylaminoacyl peptidase